jgi:hypothetical protein
MDRAGAVGAAVPAVFVAPSAGDEAAVDGAIGGDPAGAEALQAETNITTARIIAAARGNGR